MNCSTSTILLPVQIETDFMYCTYSTLLFNVQVYIKSSCTQHYCMYWLPLNFSYIYRYVYSLYTHVCFRYCTTSSLLLVVQVYIEFMYSPEVHVLYYLNTSPTCTGIYRLYVLTWSTCTVLSQHFSYMYRYILTSCTHLKYIYYTVEAWLLVIRKYDFVLHVKIGIEFA